MRLSDKATQALEQMREDGIPTEQIDRIVSLAKAHVAMSDRLEVCLEDLIRAGLPIVGHEEVEKLSFVTDSQFHK